jgi:hypothetical protein
MGKTGFLLILIIWLSVGHTQPVNLTSKLLHHDIRVFFLHDFNFTGKSGVGPEIFEVIVNYRLLPDAIEQNCIINLRIQALTYGDLANGQTEPFPLKPGQRIRITNKNLFSDSNPFSLRDYNIGPAGDDIKDKILGTGRIPSDRYRFEFLLSSQENGQILDRDDIILDITNPQTLDLLAPGLNAEEGGSTIVTRFPLFRWESSMNKFRFVIAEKIPGLHEHDSPEEIINDRIRFETTLLVNSKILDNPEMENTEGVVLPSHSFQYPATAWPLESGKTYYWRLEGLVATSGTPMNMPSPVWAFTIQNDLSNTWTDRERELIIDMLSTLSMDAFQNLFGPGGLLQNYKPTGTVLLNGRPVSIQELRDLLTKLENGTIPVIGISVD